MKFFETIRAFFDKLSRKYYVSKLAKRNQRLNNLSCESINVIEFNGRLYISYNGTPIVRVEDLQTEVTEVLAQSRQDYLAWKAKFNE